MTYARNYIRKLPGGALKNNAMPGPDMIQKLFMIAAVRTLFVALALIGEQQYRLLLTKADHESRYQRLFLMTTGLKTEIYLMHKNTEEIERVMSNATSSMTDSGKGSSTGNAADGT